MVNTGCEIWYVQCPRCSRAIEYLKVNSTEWSNFLPCPNCEEPIDYQMAFKITKKDYEKSRKIAKKLKN